MNDPPVKPSCPIDSARLANWADATEIRFTGNATRPLEGRGFGGEGAGFAMLASRREDLVDKVFELMDPLAEKVLKKAKDDADSLRALIKASYLDLKWHADISGKDTQSVEAFEKQAFYELGLDFKAIPPRYRTPYFLHVFASGYSARYYSYLWTELYAADG